MKHPDERPSQPERPEKDIGYRPRVVVRFQRSTQLPYKDDSGKYIEEAGIGPWSRLEKKYPGIRLRRMFTAQDPEQIAKLLDRAQKLDRDYRPGNLLGYFIIDCPHGVDPHELARELRQWPGVETAYFDPPGAEPAVNAADDPRWPDQGYLDPAPDGIDAEYAWTFPGGDGAGLRFIDLERGWTLDHEDLIAQGAALLHGANLDTSRYHGTAVMGEVCAVDNTLGCVGITPNLALAGVVSYHGSSRSNAMLASLGHLEHGDLLLLEAQVDIGTGWLPIEVLDAEYDVIRLATALGIIVVEAAGNGNNDLDAFTDGGGNQILNRLDPAFRDSGAIMVGASSSLAPHTRMWFSNYGSRVDCYAWGENVNTCTSDAAGSTTTYTTTFSGTSSASPIISGAALLLQGIAEATVGYRFSPWQLRNLLADPATGTPSNNPAADRIGVMPDLRAILDSGNLGLAPDVYLRDYVGDVGDPHTGSISASPDIILQPDPVPDPQAAYGEGSGTENSSTLGSQIEIGQDNYLYVRVRNRGGSAAAAVEATVYWSPVASLVTPDLWTLVGGATLPSVPAGDVLTVLPAITWPEADLPGEGHYCLVGLIGCAQDPAPNPSDLIDWDNFRRFIRDNNNVTWRNFNVVDNEPDPDEGDPDGWVPLPFLAPGAPDRARPMRLEVVARLPEGARVVLETPPYLGDRLHRWAAPLPPKVDKRRELARLPLRPYGRQTLGDLVLPARARPQCRLLVHIPKEWRKHEYEISVRQHDGDLEVGRVTWRLAPLGKRQKVR